MKSSAGAISGFSKYQMKVNPSKHDTRGTTDKKFNSYLVGMDSEGSKSKEDLRYVPVENISLFEGSNAPLSARNQRSTAKISTNKIQNIGPSLFSIPFVRNFKYLKVFKKWIRYTKRQRYLKKRRLLAERLPWSKHHFANFIPSIIEPLNEIKYCSPLIDKKTKNVYTKEKNSYLGFIAQCTKRQDQTLPTFQKKFLTVVKSIETLLKFSNSSKRVLESAVKYACIACVFSIQGLIRTQQTELTKLLTTEDDPSSVLFDFQMNFDHNGNVVTDPSFDDYTNHILHLYNSLKKVVLEYDSVQKFMFDIVSIYKAVFPTLSTMSFCVHPLDYIKRKSHNREEKDHLEKHICSNIKKANE
jgi:hypothetical protein